MAGSPFMRDVFLDLDGTITDSMRGILGSARIALQRYGIEEPATGLRFMIGPPLLDSFTRLSGDTSVAALCVKAYREYYAEKGIFECDVYPGVREMLASMQDTGCRIHLATSKPQPFAQRIIEHFDLSPYFTHIGGADMVGPVQKKADVLARAIQETGASPSCSLMAGDRCYDIDGGHACALKSAAALWGYGPNEEFVEADFLCPDPAILARVAITGKVTA